MTDQSIIRTNGAAQVPSHRDSFMRYVANRIAYNQTRAATTEYVDVRAHALSEIQRYKSLIGGAA